MCILYLQGSEEYGRVRRSDEGVRQANDIVERVCRRTKYEREEMSKAKATKEAKRKKQTLTQRVEDLEELVLTITQHISNIEAVIKELAAGVIVNQRILLKIMKGEEEPSEDFQVMTA